MKGKPQCCQTLEMNCRNHDDEIVFSNQFASKRPPPSLKGGGVCEMCRRLHSEEPRLSILHDAWIFVKVISNGSTRFVILLLMAIVLSLTWKYSWANPNCLILQGRVQRCLSQQIQMPGHWLCMKGIDPQHTLVACFGGNGAYRAPLLSKSRTREGSGSRQFIL